MYILVIIYSYSPCYYEEFDLTNFGNVSVGCINSYNTYSSSYRPCYHATFNASTSNRVDINCHGYYGCYSTNYYCPSHYKKCRLSRNICV